MTEQKTNRSHVRNVFRAEDAAAGKVLGNDSYEAQKEQRSHGRIVRVSAADGIFRRPNPLTSHEQDQQQRSVIRTTSPRVLNRTGNPETPIPVVV
jgi:hypothetical protein